MPGPTNNSGLRDNHTRGTVADFLKAKIQNNSKLSVVSAYFTIYAYDALKEVLDPIDHLDFLFGEPSFINRLDPSKTEKKSFIIDADGLELANTLQQKRVARECAEWIDRKVDIKTIKESNLLHGKMYHVATAGVEDAILGSSNFTVRGLGLGSGGNNIELNLIVRANSPLNPFISDRFRYDVMSHTDLSRETGYSGDINLATLNWGNYDLIAIDESHNFRNNTPGRRDEAGNLIRKSRYQRLMDDIITAGVRTKVLLLSATPVNNDLKDLRNQLYFFTENRDDAFSESLGIHSLKETLTAAQKVFSLWARKQSAERKTGELLEKLNVAFFKLLDELTIARSRKHIQKYYKATIAQLGGFPKREKPISIYPEIDLRGRFLSYDKLNDEIAAYKLSLFNPSKYVKEEFRVVYQTPTRDPFSQADRETFLIGMMKVNFLKRLESSVKSFEITMERTITKIEGLEAKIKNYLSLPDQNPESQEMEVELDDPGHDEELEAAMLVGGKFKYRLEHLELDHGKNWLKDLKKDKDQLRILFNAAQDVVPDTDAKLAELKKLIAAKVAKPTTNKLDEPNKKVLVFTAFADTATYLYDSLLEWGTKQLGIHMALVCGGGDTQTTLGGSAYDQILTNFSPRAKHRAKIPSMPQKDEVDLLIATDCISEGQNLQDCDFLINYDIHWNPVRIIQRFGRIDRIGSASHTVQLVNFWPTEDLNKYINLKNRVEARMALVDIAATFEDNVLKNDEIEEIISEDLRYRDKQLLRLKDEVLDLEDLGDSISLTEFTLDDFRLELLKYIEANKAALEDAPFGLYTCVPPHPDHKIIGPGVIFCFRQEGQRGGGIVAKPSPSESINPLHPYFLVYVLDVGNVRFGFSHPKQILDIYRVLCSGNAEPYTPYLLLVPQGKRPHPRETLPPHGSCQYSQGIRSRE